MLSNMAHKATVNKDVELTGNRTQIDADRNHSPLGTIAREQNFSPRIFLRTVAFLVNQNNIDTMGKNPFWKF